MIYAAPSMTDKKETHGLTSRKKIINYKYPRQKTKWSKNNRRHVACKWVFFKRAAWGWAGLRTHLDKRPKINQETCSMEWLGVLTCKDLLEYYVTIKSNVQQVHSMRLESVYGEILERTRNTRGA